jgi:16S rRNA G966 N2-methylase RsmD
MAIAESVTGVDASLVERHSQEDRLRVAGIGVDGGGQSTVEGASWDIFLDPPYDDNRLHSVAEVDAFLADRVAESVTS